MDRDWMYEMLDSSRRLRQPFIDGVHHFVSKAMNQVSYIPDGGVRCPCVKCCCEKILKPSHVRSHLLQHGFQPNYKVWIYHGEVRTNEVNLNIASTSFDNIRRDDDFGSLVEMVNNAYMQESDIRTRYVNVIEDVEEQPNAEAQKFYDMLASAHQPIYDGATESKLSIAIRLLGARSNWHTSEKCLDSPTENCIPKTYYEAKKVVSTLGLKAIKIDCCEAGCMLYYKDDIELNECKFCGLPRYLPPKGQNKTYKRVPIKRMFYLPIIPRLQRLYTSMESARQMRWHYENRTNDDVLRHPSDGKSWKHFDSVYPEFAAEPRNVRLGLCSDGFTPYIQASASPYSCWPVFVTPYNLPPEMCMTKPYMFLSCLVPGPTNPTKK
ncbi:uncharacterized protein [Phaseolus vulgaris]|uniref:uncharacterized protein n=1 Tax=Phaseolus vulgaris TaxID=3885 RepID=UPI0035C9E6BB